MKNYEVQWKSDILAWEGSTPLPRSVEENVPPGQEGHEDQQLHSCNQKALLDLERWATPASNCTVWK